MTPMPSCQYHSIISAIIWRFFKVVFPIQLPLGYLWVNDFCQILLEVPDKIVRICFLLPQSVQAEFILAGYLFKQMVASPRKEICA